MQFRKVVRPLIRMAYWMTQCYLPPGRSDIAAFGTTSAMPFIFFLGSVFKSSLVG